MPPAEDEVVAATSAGATVGSATPPAKAVEAARVKAAARAIFFILFSIYCTQPSVGRGGRCTQDSSSGHFSSRSGGTLQQFHRFFPMKPEGIVKKATVQGAFFATVTILSHRRPPRRAALRSATPACPKRPAQTVRQFARCTGRCSNLTTAARFCACHGCRGCDRSASQDTRP